MYRPCFLTIAMIAACSGGEGNSTRQPDAAGGATGRLVVTITSGEDPTMEVEARFLSYRGFDEVSANGLANGLVGAQYFPAGSLVSGGCTRLDSDYREHLVEDALSSASPESSVQLLDAGEIVAKTGNERSGLLLPRYLPEIMPLVSGVLYETQRIPLAGDGFLPFDDNEDGAVVLSGTGGDEVGRFAVTASIPRPPRIIAVAGTNAGEAFVHEHEHDLEVEWSAPAPSSEEQVVLSVSVAGSEWTGELRCRLEGDPSADTQHTLIDRTMLLGIAPGSVLGVAIDRLAQSSFTAAGLGHAELEIRVRDVVTGTAR
ncbi:MAG: hypothetical protein V2A73_11380 [Pseudomonadota bacterium]